MIIDIEEANGIDPYYYIYTEEDKIINGWEKSRFIDFFLKKKDSHTFFERKDNIIRKNGYSEQDIVLFTKDTPTEEMLEWIDNYFLLKEIIT